MTMRYAHLSPAFMSAEVSLLDLPAVPTLKEEDCKRPRKGNVPISLGELGLSAMTRT